MKFAEMTAPAIRRISKKTTLVVAPIAAIEQHSRHLPVITDTVLVTAVAEGLERNLPGHVLLLPTQWLGASEHHLPFGGTLTATLSTYELMLMEILRPLLHDGFGRVMLLNGHGGNIDPLQVALRRLDREFPSSILTGSAYWDLAAAELAACCTGPRTSMGHACELETSMMMALRPELVCLEEIEDDPDMTPAAVKSIFWTRDFGRRTDHGAVGYPSFATAQKGQKMLEAAIGAVTRVSRGILELPLG
ncbi:MAG: creatininase family protein [Planctomycetota bacterium]|nr:MAG: creatininase family protein [Planctomycetota bacterium]